MRKILMAGIVITGLVGCGGNKDEARARDSTLAANDSTYALNDRPAPSPAPSPAAANPSPPAAPAPAPAPSTPRMLTLAAGTLLEGTLSSTISSKTNKVGDRVTVRVASDVKNSSGVVVVPAGSTIDLTVTSIEPARDKSSAAGKLTLAVTGITVRGDSYPIQADVSSIITSMKGGGVGTSEAAKVGAGAVIGGIAGRVIGGDKTGTIIGAVVGAAAGAAVAVETANRNVVVAAGSTVGITLREPLRVTRS
jgi:glycine zipper 2TM protein